MSACDDGYGRVEMRGVKRLPVVNLNAQPTRTGNEPEGGLLSFWGDMISRVESALVCQNRH